MKHVFLIIFCIISFSSFSQSTLPIDTIYKGDTAAFFIRPNFEFGYLQLKNQDLIKKYKTSTMFMWSIGFQIYNNKESLIYPYFKLQNTNYSIQIQKETDSVMAIYNTFLLKQYTFGLNFKMLKMTKTTMNGKIAYSHSLIKESFYSINNQAYGFEFGLGIERRFSKNSKFYSDFIINYLKTEKNNFRDFDNTKISFGFCF